MKAHHPVLWTAPSPLAARLGLASADAARPALLRFDRDDFVEQLLATLAAAPREIAGFVARPETWRTPQAPGADLVERTPQPSRMRALAWLARRREPNAAVAAPAASATLVQQGQVREQPLKLYQPAHQRHYLVAAQLACGIAGLPDRAVAGGGREKLGFVIRRLLPAADDPTRREEYAFVKDAAGARWQRLAGDPAQLLADGEELLPLFPASFADDAPAAQGRARRLWLGSLPVGRREEYMTTRAERSPPGAPAGVAAEPSAVAARKEQFRLEVAEPWKNLVRTAVLALPRLNQGGSGAPSATQREAAAAALNAQLQAGAWLTLLDFADWLAVQLPGVWRVLKGEAAPGTLSGAARTLADWLRHADTAAGGSGFPFTAAPGAATASLADALVRVSAPRAREGLERATVLFPDANDAVDAAGAALGWPAFTQLLAGAFRRSDGVYEARGPHLVLPAPPAAEDPLPPATGAPALREAEQAAARIDRLVQMAVAALDATAPAADTPPLPFAVSLRDALATTAGDEGWFCVRHVFLRCDCGPLQPPLLSAASVEFQLASFFDPDAPARPVRIALPLDTTPAGLRKHPKNAALIVSDVLCGQVQRAKGLGLVDLVLSVLPWPLNKPLSLGGTGKCKSGGSVDIGMICSLSIPIVTLCALILLMVIVSLLDFIFRWLPWFVMCLPVPGLKGKK